MSLMGRMGRGSDACSRQHPTERETQSFCAADVEEASHLDVLDGFPRLILLIVRSFLSSVPLALRVSQQRPTTPFPSPLYLSIA
jgi:hypothetical protein